MFKQFSSVLAEPKPVVFAPLTCSVMLGLGMGDTPHMALVTGETAYGFNTKNICDPSITLKKDFIFWPYYPALPSSVVSDSTEGAPLG